MLLQLLSDLHLESEVFDPQPAPEAELLVLAGDIDVGWSALQRFARWPVPVLMVAGNHEMDGRDLGNAWEALRHCCADAGITLLQRQSLRLRSASGRWVRFLGTTRWPDFDGLGEARRDKAMRAAAYHLQKMASRIDGQPLDAAALRAQGLACRQWLQAELQRPNPAPADGGWDATVVITHYAPSLRSADPRFGHQNSTASFCNADDDLIALADLWLHGHVHARHDYTVARPGPSAQPPARVVCQARGLAAKGEVQGLDALRVLRVPLGTGVSHWTIGPTPPAT